MFTTLYWFSHYGQPSISDCNSSSATKDSMAVLNRAAGNGATCRPTSRDQYKSHWSIPMKLRRNEFCPIHRSLFCCGREQARKERRFQLGVQRIEDPHHPRGYRELRSPAEMRKLLNRKIAEQDGKCAICHAAVHGLQRDCARPYRAQRDGRSVERRPPGEYPSRPSAVQSPEGIEKTWRLMTDSVHRFVQAHEMQV